MGDLRERMRQAMVARGWPEATRDAYLGWGYDLAKHYMRSPELLSGDEVQRYVSHLCVERQLEAASAQTAGAALRFLYEDVLGRPRMELPGYHRARSAATVVTAATVTRATGTTHAAVLERVVTAVAMGAALRESAKGVLRERMRQAMVLRGLGLRTQEAYLGWGRDLALQSYSCALAFGYAMNAWTCSRKLAMRTERAEPALAADARKGARG